MREDFPPASRTALKGALTLRAGELRDAGGKPTIGQNLRAQAGVLSKKFFCAGSESELHPIAGGAVLGAAEFYSIELKVLADEREKFNARDDDVAAEHTGRFVDRRKGGAELIENFAREKCDLTFVVSLVIEIAVAAEAATGDAFDAFDFLQWECVRLAAEMTDEVVAGGDEDLLDLHGEKERRALGPPTQGYGAAGPLAQGYGATGPPTHCSGAAGAERATLDERLLALRALKRSLTLLADGNCPACFCLLEAVSWARDRDAFLRHFRDAVSDRVSRGDEVGDR
ncbi:MAG: hypothetical protein ABIR71_02845 [Chthoniobacterales bacterium]